MDSKSYRELQHLLFEYKSMLMSVCSELSIHLPGQKCYDKSLVRRLKKIFGLDDSVKDAPDMVILTANQKNIFTMTNVDKLHDALLEVKQYHIVNDIVNSYMNYVNRWLNMHDNLECEVMVDLVETLEPVQDPNVLDLLERWNVGHDEEDVERTRQVLMIYHSNEKTPDSKDVVPLYPTYMWTELYKNITPKKFYESLNVYKSFGSLDYEVYRLLAYLFSKHEYVPMSSLDPWRFLMVLLYLFSPSTKLEEIRKTYGLCAGPKNPILQLMEKGVLTHDTLERELDKLNGPGPWVGMARDFLFDKEEFATKFFDLLF